MKIRLNSPRTALSPAAFTLIEVLLVVAIMGVVAAITVPSFARSIKGNRLRTAARTVVMAARYSRSMCLLNQQDMTIVFDLKTSRISVYSKPNVDDAPPDPAGEGSGDAVLGLRPGRLDAAKSESGVEPGVPGKPPADAFGKLEFERELDRVTLESVVLEGGSKLARGRKPVGGSKPTGDSKSTDDRVAVPYHSNGTCTPYTVRVVDADDNAVTVRVDMLSAVETERN